MNNALIRVSSVKKYYPITKALLSKKDLFVHAVDGIDLELIKGETFGLVGESGCGKSTLGRVILRLEEPTSGTVTYDGRDFSEFSKDELMHLRAKLQIIFQDPYSSLNPENRSRRSSGRG